MTQNAFLHFHEFLRFHMFSHFIPYMSDSLNSMYKRTCIVHEQSVQFIFAIFQSEHLGRNILQQNLSKLRKSKQISISYYSNTNCTKVVSTMCKRTQKYSNTVAYLTPIHTGNSRINICLSFLHSRGRGLLDFQTYFEHRGALSSCFISVIIISVNIWIYVVSPGDGRLRIQKCCSFKTVQYYTICCNVLFYVIFDNRCIFCCNLRIFQYKEKVEYIIQSTRTLK